MLYIFMLTFNSLGNSLFNNKKILGPSNYSNQEVHHIILVRSKWYHGWSHAHVHWRVIRREITVEYLVVIDVKGVHEWQKNNQWIWWHDTYEMNEWDEDFQDSVDSMM